MAGDSRSMFSKDGIRYSGPTDRARVEIACSSADTEILNCKVLLNKCAGARSYDHLQWLKALFSSSMAAVLAEPSAQKMSDEGVLLFYGSKPLDLF